MIIMRLYRFEVNMTPVREFQDKAGDTTASGRARRTEVSFSLHWLHRPAVRLVTGDLFGEILSEYSAEILRIIIFARNISLKLFSKTY